MALITVILKSILFARENTVKLDEIRHNKNLLQNMLIKNPSDVSKRKKMYF